MAKKKGEHNRDHAEAQTSSSAAGEEAAAGQHPMFAATDTAWAPWYIPRIPTPF